VNKSLSRDKGYNQALRLRFGQRRPEDEMHDEFAASISIREEF